MTDQQLYNLIHSELFKTGSCTTNKWIQISVKVSEGKYLNVLALCPSKGNVRLRKPIKLQKINSDNEEIWAYNQYRFTNKRELKWEGIAEDIRQKEVVSV